MSKYRLGLLACLLLAACSPRHSEKMEDTASSEAAPESAAASSLAEANYTSPATALACDFPVRQTDTADSLLKTYQSYAKVGTIPGPEGTEEKGVILYGNDPRRKVEVVFADETMTRVSIVIIRGDSQWAGPKGLHLGSSIADVETANGKPFNVGGFDWDYGGYVTDLNGGKLAHVGKCVLGLRFGFDDKAGPVAASIEGEKTLISTDPAVVAAKPVVQEMTVGWDVSN